MPYLHDPPCLIFCLEHFEAFIYGCNKLRRCARTWQTKCASPWTTQKQSKQNICLLGSTYPSLLPSGFKAANFFDQFSLYFGFLKDVAGLPPDWTDVLPGQAKRLPATGFELPDCHVSFFVSKRLHRKKNPATCQQNDIIVTNLTF